MYVLQIDHNSVDAELFAREEHSLVTSVYIIYIVASEEVSYASSRTVNLVIGGTNWYTFENVFLIFRYVFEIHF